MAEWTFFTNHAHVLVCIARDPDARIRDMALAVGITERAAQAIVADLVEAGYLGRERVGRRNRYRVNADLPLRHPLEIGSSIGDVLGILTGRKRSRTTPVTANPVEAAPVTAGSSWDAAGDG